MNTETPGEKRKRPNDEVDVLKDLEMIDSGHMISFNNDEGEKRKSKRSKTEKTLTITIDYDSIERNYLSSVSGRISEGDNGTIECGGIDQVYYDCTFKIANTSIVFPNTGGQRILNLSSLFPLLRKSGVNSANLLRKYTLNLDYFKFRPSKYNIPLLVGIYEPYCFCFENLFSKIYSLIQKNLLLKVQHLSQENNHLKEENQQLKCLNEKLEDEKEELKMKLGSGRKKIKTKIREEIGNLGIKISNEKEPEFGDLMSIDCERVVSLVQENCEITFDILLYAVQSDYTRRNPESCAAKRKVLGVSWCILLLCRIRNVLATIYAFYLSIISRAFHGTLGFLHALSGILRIFVSSTVVYDRIVDMVDSRNDEGWNANMGKHVIVDNCGYRNKCRRGFTQSLSQMFVNEFLFTSLRLDQLWNVHVMLIVQNFLMKRIEVMGMFEDGLFYLRNTESIETVEKFGFYNDPKFYVLESAIGYESSSDIDVMQWMIDIYEKIYGGKEEVLSLGTGDAFEVFRCSSDQQIVSKFYNLQEEGYFTSTLIHHGAFHDKANYMLCLLQCNWTFIIEPIHDKFFPEMRHCGFKGEDKSKISDYGDVLLKLIAIVLKNYFFRLFDVMNIHSPSDTEKIMFFEERVVNKIKNKPLKKLYYFFKDLLGLFSYQYNIRMGFTQDTNWKYNFELYEIFEKPLYKVLMFKAISRQLMVQDENVLEWINDNPSFQFKNSKLGYDLLMEKVNWLLKEGGVNTEAENLDYILAFKFLSQVIRHKFMRSLHEYLGLSLTKKMKDIDFDETKKVDMMKFVTRKFGSTREDILSERELSDSDKALMHMNDDKIFEQRQTKENLKITIEEKIKSFNKIKTNYLLFKNPYDKLQQVAWKQEQRRREKERKKRRMMQDEDNDESEEENDVDDIVDDNNQRRNSDGSDFGNYAEFQDDLQIDDAEEARYVMGSDEENQ